MASLRDQTRPVLVLASGSPRRRDLLGSIGVSPRVLAVDIDETPCPGEVAEQLVTRLAGAKAEAGFRRHSAGRRAVPEAGQVQSCLVIGADTVVELDGRILGKPADDEEMVDTLRHLAGRTHQVYTGVAVVGAAGSAGTDTTNARAHEIVDHRGDADMDRRSTVVRTDVTFRPLSENEITWYVTTGEGRDKAGSYAIQGLGSLLVMCVEGCYPNVVGLPLVAVDRLLRYFARSLPDYADVPARPLASGR